MILITDKNKYSERAIKTYRKIGKVWYPDDNKDPADVKVIVAGLNIEINEQFLKRFYNVKVIATPTTGLNHVDLYYCKEKGITVVHLNNKEFLKNITSTAELTITLILMMYRKLTYNMKPEFDVSKRDDFTGNRLKGRTLMLIGHGRIGKMVDQYGRAFGMKVVGYDIEYTQPKEHYENLLRIADIVSLHASYQTTNENMVDRYDFDLMKDDALFVNTARGELVNENDLLYWLRNTNGRAALDVIRDELKNPNQELLEYSKENPHKLYITPHIGGLAIEDIYATQEYIANSVLELFTV